MPVPKFAKEHNTPLRPLLFCFFVGVGRLNTEKVPIEGWLMVVMVESLVDG